MVTANEYRARISKLKNNIYINGKVVGRDDPRLQPGVNVVAATYDAFGDPALESMIKTHSHITGKEVSRFCHVSQNVEDLITKQKLIRSLCHKTGGCVGRCMGIDALHAISVVTYEMDRDLHTEYHKHFLNYLKNFQEKDLCGCCAQTDVKGDRRKRPHEQADPDLYLRIVERRKDGIVVRGAKAHNSIAPNADEIIVVPTRALTPEEGDWAVSFAIPADWEGVYLSASVHSFRAREKLDAPISKIGMTHSVTIFDDAFIPWERVFMAGEHKYAGRLALLFALFHRHSYTGCKPALTDVICGSAALVAEYLGIEGAQHVRHNLVDMASVAELVYGSGVAAAYCGEKSDSGTFIPNSLYCNVARRHAGLNVYKEYEQLVELTGGLPDTLPTEGDFYEKKIGPLLHKYLMRNPNISAEDQHRLFRFLGDFVSSAMAGTKQLSGVHGGGSPIMEEIAIYGNYDWNDKKKLAKYLAGIKDKPADATKPRVP